MPNRERYSMPPTQSLLGQSPEISDHQVSQSSADKMNPSSPLLQGLLREKKASQHARRASHQSDFATYERQVQSSPMGPSAASRDNGSSNRRISGHAAPNEMGLREMEEYISRINKQNFDLKLEIFHRRQRSEALEAKAEKAEELEAQNDELRQINDDLLVELQKRDVAVDEAVALICDLEARIDQVEAERLNNATTAGSPIVGDPQAGNSQTPERPVTPLSSHRSREMSTAISSVVEDRKGTLSPDRAEHNPHGSPFRKPSFLRDDKPSTSALRGLFQKHGGSATSGLGIAKSSTRSLHRTGSFLSQDEYPETVDGDTLSLHLRRLSMLSESSFVSGFGESKERITPSIAHRSPPAASPTRDDGMSLTRNLSAQEGRIRSWIANKDHPASPSKRSVTSLRPETFSSIGEILVPHQPNTRDVRAPVSPTPSKKHRQQVPPQQPSRADYKPSFAGPIFGPDVLPPTPGTMSTATLGGRSSNHSIVAERSLAGTYRQVSGSTAAADDGPYESTFATRSLRGDAAHGVSQVYPNDDTDIEISDDEQHLIAAARDKNDASNYPKDFSGKDNAQRPALTSHVTKSMFNGEDIDAFRPARTISYPSPDRSNQSASQNAPMSNRKASHSTKANGEKTSSAQKASPLGPVVPRPLPSRSQSSYPAAQTQTPNFATRLFRRNPSQQPQTQMGNQPLTQHEETPSPGSKVRPPRPSSLYLHSTPSQLPPPVPPKAPRVSRPGTAGTPPANTRRHSLTVDAAHNDNAIANGSTGASPQQQNKRLSVGAIGRSASLKIKEGFARKK